jgi:hypothetical protein
MGVACCIVDFSYNRWKLGHQLLASLAVFSVNFPLTFYLEGKAGICRTVVQTIIVRGTTGASFVIRIRGNLRLRTGIGTLEKARQHTEQRSSFSS